MVMPSSINDQRSTNNKIGSSTNEQQNWLCEQRPTINQQLKGGSSANINKQQNWRFHQRPKSTHNKIGASTNNQQSTIN